MRTRREHVDELLQLDHEWELRFVRTLPHPPHEVWRALTEPDRFSSWFPFAMEGECTPRAPLRFVGPEGQDPAIEGEMLTCDEPSRLEFRWGGGEHVRFDLEPTGPGSTRLALVNTIGELGKAARDAAGWHVTLERLAAVLDGREPPETTSEEWRALFRAYAEDFGSEAASVGLPERHGERA
jgi:uncharacterized protein YndB with AHSA1/START domain